MIKIFKSIFLYLRNCRHYHIVMKFCHNFSFSLAVALDLIVNLINTSLEQHHIVWDDL